VTDIGVLCADVPASSVAATVNVYGVFAVTPAVTRLVPVVVPIDAPFLNTV
jgi:hypothetical protein